MNQKHIKFVFDKEKTIKSTLEILRKYGVVGANDARLQGGIDYYKMKNIIHLTITGNTYDYDKIYIGEIISDMKNGDRTVRYGFRSGLGIPMRELHMLRPKAEKILIKWAINKWKANIDIEPTYEELL